MAQGDLGVKEAGGDGVDQGLKRAALTGAEDA